MADVSNKKNALPSSSYPPPSQKAYPAAVIATVSSNVVPAPAIIAAQVASAVTRLVQPSTLEVSGLASG